MCSQLDDMTAPDNRDITWDYGAEMAIKVAEAEIVNVAKLRAALDEAETLRAQAAILRERARRETDSTRASWLRYRAAIAEDRADIIVGEGDWGR